MTPQEFVEQVSRLLLSSEFEEDSPVDAVETLDSLIGAARAITGPVAKVSPDGKITCPHCGKVTEPRWGEYVFSQWRGTGTFDATSKTFRLAHDRDNREDTEGGAWFCEHCCEDFSLPAGYEPDFDPDPDELRSSKGLRGGGLGSPHDAEGPGHFPEDEAPEPDQDDTVHCCPECETPNQFGELCLRCQREIDAEREPGGAS